ncbi:GNAT family N-acetyltransferase [Sporolactobacillus sp. CPB3-1]|uniref:GNAT family N-acetyltransferase n=1 Tax=Sporolactobacillus mangiferae TaxID=2940498 RepID=A0ABT0MD74_9BACL|nr:GNAT family protein [Sporolactobacillus mangiferae]MCL1632817.1 GNAT family N-acetyltransferase [Sporolactobacillus mangiferae]
MDYRFELMSQDEAEEIAYQWHYDGIYAFYNMEADEEDLEEMLDSSRRGQNYFSVYDHEGLIGFFCFYKINQQTTEIGLGMKPEQTGKGNGADFVSAGLAFAVSRDHPKMITLSVAAFNRRAIKVYLKVGFEEEKRYMQATNGGHYEFITMIYRCH